MSQLEYIEAIEKVLWKAADTLRTSSNYASNEYFLPVMGLVFLRHAYSPYLTVKAKIEPTLPSRGGKTRALTKEDFSQQSAIYLQPQAQFDSLVSLPGNADRAKAIIEAMESIEKDYDNLRGILPKSEYQELDNEVLGQLLRTLNPEELKTVKGDVFGRIYEYFLTQFADQKAHDAGEFFTPVSLVSLIAHVLDPERGTVLDPACGSGGMFVQSARIVEEHGDSPTEKLTFRGLAIVRLYRGQTERYLDLVAGYCRRMMAEGMACFTVRVDDGELVEPLPDFITSLATLRSAVEPFLKSLDKDAPHAEALKELDAAIPMFNADVEAFQETVTEQQAAWEKQKTTNGELKKAVDRLAPMAETSRDLIKQTDLLYKLATRLVEALQQPRPVPPSPAGRGAGGEGAPQKSVNGVLRKSLKALDEARELAVEQLKQVRYFWKQAHWLTERFPDAQLRNVEGLVKLVDLKEIQANDWSLTPGRYVGVAPEETDENFDFEEALREIHVELEGLNAEAIKLAATIKKNFEELGI